MVRAVVGVLMILPIVWIVARTGTVEMITEIPVGIKQRHFKGVRTRVVQLLDEIRRLNWLAVDAERGFRDKDEAMHEMDRIESRLKEIISEIRQSAGQSSGEAGPEFDDPGTETEEAADEPTSQPEATILPAEEESGP